MSSKNIATTTCLSALYLLVLIVVSYIDNTVTLMLVGTLCYVLTAYFLSKLEVECSHKLTLFRWIDISLYTFISVVLIHSVIKLKLIPPVALNTPDISFVTHFLSGALIAGLLLKLKVLSVERKIFTNTEFSYPSLFWAIFFSFIGLLFIFYNISENLDDVSLFAICLMLGFISNFILQKTQLSLSKPANSDAGNSASDTQTDHQDSFEGWLEKEQPLISDDSKYAKGMGFDYTDYLNELKNLVERRANIAIVGHYGSGKTSLANLALEQGTIQREEGEFKIIRIPITTWGHAPNSINEFILSEILKKLAQHIDVFRFQGLPQHYASSLQASKPGILRVLGKFFEPNSEDPKEQLGALNQILQRQKLIVYLVIDDIERNPNLETLLPQVASLLDDIKHSYGNIQFIINLTTNLTELPSQFLRKADSTQAENTNSPPSIPPSAVLTLDNINALNRVYTSKVVINPVDPERSWDYIKDSLQQKLETLFNLKGSTEGAFTLKRAIIHGQLKSNLLVDLKLDGDAKTPRYVKYLIRSFWFSLTKEVAHNTKAATIIPLSSLLEIALYKQGAGADVDPNGKKIQQDEYYKLFTAQAEPNNYYDVGQFIDAVYSYPTQPEKLDSISLLQCRNCLSYMSKYPASDSFQLLDDFLTKLLQVTTPFESLNDDVLQFLVKITKTFFCHLPDKEQPVTHAKYLDQLCSQINEWIESGESEKHKFVVDFLEGLLHSETIRPATIRPATIRHCCQYLLDHIPPTPSCENHTEKLVKIFKRFEQSEDDTLAKKVNTLIDSLLDMQTEENAMFDALLLLDRVINGYLKNGGQKWKSVIQHQSYCRYFNPEQDTLRNRNYLIKLARNELSKNTLAPKLRELLDLFYDSYPSMCSLGILTDPHHIRAYLNAHTIQKKQDEQLSSVFTEIFNNLAKTDILENTLNDIIHRLASSAHTSIDGYWGTVQSESIFTNLLDDNLFFGQSYSQKLTAQQANFVIALLHALAKSEQNPLDYLASEERFEKSRIYLIDNIIRLIESNSSKGQYSDYLSVLRRERDN